VLQDPSSQLLNATVAEEIAFAATNLGADPAAVERATACWSRALGLEADLGRDPRTLSAGRQQMVLLAAALAASPRLLCADEATAHLDREARSRVRSVIAGEVGRGLTVIWATQDAEELAVAGRVLPVGPTVSGPPATVSPAGGRRSGAEGAFATVQISTDGPVTGPRVMASRPIEFVVPKCGVTALLGPNASGKSLVLAALAGLEAPGQVTIRWEGPTEPPPIIALQYPELQVFEESVGDELVFAAVSRGVPRAKALDQARQALRNLEIESEAMVRRRTWTLSTGEKRLIEVVGALIAPACLVLLDEPTAGLDAKRREALSRLTARRAEGVPVVVATQDHEWVETLEAQIQRLGA
jgi:energy-coupling factor transport system ATP-binding protein